LANIQDVDVKKFVRKNIVTRFKVLKALVSDNGLQFDSKTYRKRTAVASELKTCIRHQHILRAMVRPKPQTKLLSTN